MNEAERGSDRSRSLDPGALIARLEQLVGSLRGRQLAVAYSGGADSTAALVLLAESARCVGFSLRAIHVDHGLHPDSGAWVAHCRRVCAALGHTVEVFKVDVVPGNDGIESAARDARMAAFAAALAPGEILVTGQHLEDQAETVLHALLRGSGLPGLSGMPGLKPCGAGLLARPFLGIEKSVLRQVCSMRGLEVIDDPSNAAVNLARGYLREAVAPVLRTRWPGYASAMARSATHASEATELLAALAAHDLQTCDAGTPPPFALAQARINAERLSALDDARIRNALRHWLRGVGVRSPASRQLQSVVDVLVRRARSGVISWDDVDLCRYREELYIVPSISDCACPREWNPELVWMPTEPLELPEMGVRLLPRRVVGEGLSVNAVTAGLTVRSRGGGERVRLPGRAGHRSLKNLYQELGVPPWARRRLPVLWLDNTPACVPGVGTFEGATAGAGEPGVAIDVEGFPVPIQERDLR